jgi:hypothetical protein
MVTKAAETTETEAAEETVATERTGTEGTPYECRSLRLLRYLSPSSR